MSEELKSCPFCGKTIMKKDFCSGDGFPKGCDCIWETTTADESERRWQSRPLEAALCKQLDIERRLYDNKMVDLAYYLGLEKIEANIDIDIAVRKIVAERDALRKQLEDEHNAAIKITEQWMATSKKLEIAEKTLRNIGSDIYQGEHPMILARNALAEIEKTKGEN